MIVDTIQNALGYRGLSSAFDTAFQWMTDTDLASLTEGKIEIDEERVFANLAVNQLDRSDPAYEAHDLYADIQIVLQGEERFVLGWNPRMAPLKPGTDFRTCEAEPGVDFVLTAGQFVIFFPGEAHAPGLVAKEPGPCRKMVIKVLVN